MSNGPSKEEIEKMVKLAKEMGVGDGTVETILVEGIVAMIEDAQAEWDRGNRGSAFQYQQKALKGIVTYLIKDNDARKEKHG